MSAVINSVKMRISELIERLLADLPGIRIGIMAHSDYDDHPELLLQRMDFSSDAAQLIDFVRNVKEAVVCNDLPEFYELVMHELRLKYSWTPGYQKRVVMIGDAEPHEENAFKNKLRLRWHDEALALKEQLGVSIYSVKAGTFSTEYFWRSIAEITDGVYLPLSKMQNIFDFIVAICYQEYGPDVFAPVEREIRERSDPHPELCKMLETLKSSKAGVAERAEGEPQPVAPPEKQLESTASRKRKAPAAAAAPNCGAKRVRREAEDVEMSAPLLDPSGKWSAWKTLARPLTTEDAPAGWRRFGHGVMPLHAVTKEGRLLVEMGVLRPGDAAPTVLFGRVMHLGPDDDMVRLLMRRSGALRWHMDRSLAQGRSLLFRTAALPEAPLVRAQRLALKRNNSYAWNSGRAVPDKGRSLLAARPPRRRQMTIFLRRFKALNKEPLAMT